MRNTRREQMFSALPSTTDIRRLQQHVGFVPDPDITPVARHVGAAEELGRHA
jgi:hypothetical protein